jgi:drug/metabolite transporter (DMT)-like permease
MDKANTMFKWYFFDLFNNHQLEPSPLNKSLIGITLFLIATFLIVLMNACAKLASPYHNPIELVFYRGIIAMILLLSFIAITRRKDVFKTERPFAHLGRSLAGNIGVILVFWSYAIMPMADVTAFLFTSPIMVTILSIPLLGEKVGIYRWLAVLSGFIGVLLIAQPLGNDIAIGIKALIPLAATFFTALVNIFLRELGKTEDPFTTVFYFLAFGVLFTGVYMIFYGSFLSPHALLPVIGAGIAGGLQLILKTQAYKLAEASLLGPYSYTSIVWATILGWLFWGELPTLMVVLGASIIILSNIFIYLREKRKTAS